MGNFKKTLRNAAIGLLTVGSLYGQNEKIDSNSISTKKYLIENLKNKQDTIPTNKKLNPFTSNDFVKLYNYFLHQETYFSEPFYDMNDIQVRLDTYNFPHSFLIGPLPVDGLAVTNFLIENKIAEVGSSKLLFLSTDALSLLTLSRGEQLLMKHQSGANSVLNESILFIKNILINNSDLILLSKAFSDITESSKIIKDKNKLLELEAKKTALAMQMLNIMDKRKSDISLLANKMEEVCKGFRDLFEIIRNFQQKLNSLEIYLHSVNVDNHLQINKNILQSNDKSIQDLSKRAYALYKKTYYWEAKLLELNDE